MYAEDRSPYLDDDTIDPVERYKAKILDRKRIQFNNVNQILKFFIFNFMCCFSVCCKKRWKRKENTYRMLQIAKKRLADETDIINMIRM